MGVASSEHEMSDNYRSMYYYSAPVLSRCMSHFSTPVLSRYMTYCKEVGTYSYGKYHHCKCKSLAAI